MNDHQVMDTNSPFNTVNIQYPTVSFLENKSLDPQIHAQTIDKSRNNFTNITNNPYGSQISKQSVDQRNVQSVRKPQLVGNFSTEPSSALFTRESEERNKGSVRYQNTMLVTTSSNDDQNNTPGMSQFIDKSSLGPPFDKSFPRKLTEEELDKKEAYLGRNSFNNTHTYLPNYNIENRTRNSLRQQNTDYAKTENYFTMTRLTKPTNESSMEKQNISTLDGLKNSNQSEFSSDQQCIQRPIQGIYIENKATQFQVAHQPIYGDQPSELTSGTRLFQQSIRPSTASVNRFGYATSTLKPSTQIPSELYSINMIKEHPIIGGTIKINTGSSDTTKQAISKGTSVPQLQTSNIELKTLLVEGDQVKNGTRHMIKKLNQNRQSQMITKLQINGSHEFQKVENQQNDNKEISTQIGVKQLKGKMKKYLNKRQQIIGRNIKKVSSSKEPIEEGIIPESMLILEQNYNKNSSSFKKTSFNLNDSKNNQINIDGTQKSPIQKDVNKDSSQEQSQNQQKDPNGVHKIFGDYYKDIYQSKDYDKNKLVRYKGSQNIDQKQFRAKSAHDSFPQQTKNGLVQKLHDKVYKKGDGMIIQQTKMNFSKQIRKDFSKLDNKANYPQSQKFTRPKTSIVDGRSVSQIENRKSTEPVNDSNSMIRGRSTGKNTQYNHNRSLRAEYQDYRLKKLQSHFDLYNNLKKFNQSAEVQNKDNQIYKDVTINTEQKLNLNNLDRSYTQDNLNVLFKTPQEPILNSQFQTNLSFQEPLHEQSLDEKNEKIFEKDGNPYDNDYILKQFSQKDQDLFKNFKQNLYQQVQQQQKKIENQKAQVPQSVAKQTQRKKMSAYEQKQAQFDKVYKSTLHELRKKPMGLMDSTINSVYSQTRGSVVDDIDKSYAIQENKQKGRQSPKKKQKQPLEFHIGDYNIFQRKQYQQIVSNRLRLLGLRDLRSLKHKDQHYSLDPIRMTIRTIPIDRAVDGPGAGPVSYFIQACKHGYRNDLTLAIQSLHKGLAINQDHLLCRFTHGVLMFKLGLFTQAFYDFERMIELYPDELITHYNYALTCLQLNELGEAILALDYGILNKGFCEHTSDLDTVDVVHDAHLLKAICLWRLDYPLEAVKNLEQAKRFTKAEDKKKQRIPVKHLEEKMKQLQIIEIKDDLEINIAYWNARISKSPKPSAIIDAPIPGEFYINKSENSHSQSYKRFDSVKTIQINTEAKKEIRDIENCFQKAFRNNSSGHSPVSVKQNQNQSSRAKHGDFVQINEIGKKLSKKHRNQSSRNRRPLSMSQVQGKSAQKIKEKQQISTQEVLIKENNSNLDEYSQSQPAIKIENEKSKNSLSIKEVSQNYGGSQIGASNQKINEVEELKQILEQHIQARKKIKLDAFNNKVDGFYNTLKEKQTELIDQGHNVRFDKVYSHLFDNGQGNQRQDNLTQEEQKQLQLRIAVTKDHENEQGIVEGQLPQNEARFTEFMLKGYSENKDSPIKIREIEGICFSENGVVEINRDQSQLDDLMKELKKKFEMVAFNMTVELNRDDRKLFRGKLKDADLTEYKKIADVDSNAQTKNSKSKEDVYRQDKILQALRVGLQDEYDYSHPFDLCNTLQTDIDYKNKIRKLQSQSKLLGNKRIDNQKLILIRKEFEMPARARSIQLLDLILGTLKFFSRFNEDQRKRLYERAELKQFPARHTVFRQGDEGDAMYIIIKGRVACEVTSPDWANMPIVIATKKDGDQFGELSLLDQQEVDEKSTVGSITVMNVENSEGKKCTKKMASRTASCITTEETDCLCIDIHLSQELYQPKTIASNDDQEQVADFEEQQTVDGGSLAQKVKILQKMSIFEDVDPVYLMRIAANLVPKTFKYGEFLVKQGQVPKGLYIVLQGQCRVLQTRIAQRPLDDQGDSTAGGLSGSFNQKQRQNFIREQMINDFNPMTTALNKMTSTQLQYQNQRMYIDGGQEIRKKLQYHDQMVFSELTRGEFFGARTIVPFDYYSKMKIHSFGKSAMDRYYPAGCDREYVNDEDEETYHLKSLLSIVADSSQVQVFLIDNSDMHHLTALDQERVFDKIAAMKEPDRPHHQQDIEFITDQFHKWDNYKIDCVQGLFARKKMEKFFQGYQR